MELTEEQVETIRKRIRDSGITRKDLENDLLDHLCCLVEQEMETSSFAIATDRIWGGFQPQGGMRRIQTDIEFMFNNKISNMKKIAAAILGIIYVPYYTIRKYRLLFQV
jgi:ribosomal protein S13